jgi:hypothetical protein
LIGAALHRIFPRSTCRPIAASPSFLEIRKNPASVGFFL